MKRAGLEKPFETVQQYACEKSPWRREYLVLNSKAKHLFGDVWHMNRHLAHCYITNAPTMLAMGFIYAVNFSGVCWDFSHLNAKRDDFKNAVKECLGQSASTLHAFVKYLRVQGPSVLIIIDEQVMGVSTKTADKDRENNHSAKLVLFRDEGFCPISLKVDPHDGAGIPEKRPRMITVAVNVQLYCQLADVGGTLSDKWQHVERCLSSLEEFVTRCGKMLPKYKIQDFIEDIPCSCQIKRDMGLDFTIL